MSALQSTGRPFTGRHMAVIMVSFFLVVIGVNVSMAVLANRSWTGLVVQNSYVASQHFNAETAKREALLARGYQLGIAYDGKEVAVTAVDKAGQPLAVASAVLQLNHGDLNAGHGALTLICQAGRCVGAANLAPGIWRGDLKLVLEDGEAWQQAVEIFVKDK